MNKMKTNTPQYSEFIHKSRYARWIKSKNRREEWHETVQRYMDFFHEEFIDDETRSRVKNAILNLDVMPSMRALMTAGDAANHSEIALYNCAFIACDDPFMFSEVMYILMNGTGVGFSVERQHIGKLPLLSAKLEAVDDVIVVGDSKEGWAEAYNALLNKLYAGAIPKWDVSQVRAKGERLKIFGGRACLTGDTVLYKDRKKTRSYNEITVKELYQLKNSEGFWKGKPNHFKAVKLRSLNEKTGGFYRNNVNDVIYNGVAPVYEIRTKQGYKIRATGNHRFMRDTGEYDYVDNFNVDDLIAVNGSKERKTGVCKDCGTPISRRAIRCKPCSDTARQLDTALGTTARQRKECLAYRKDYCEECLVTGCDFEVHHIDRNPRNNDPSNLRNLCVRCHNTLHAREDTCGDPYSHKYVTYDEIKSIEYAGEEDVYDLCMDAPDHNFIANGFISHNSGSDPLVELFEFTIDIFKNATGEKLKSIECHDIVCKIANVVVAGGVRRSALISLSNLTDHRMSKAKSGDWWIDNPQRALANNSVNYTEKPEVSDFMTEFKNLYESRAGERGIYSSHVAGLSIPERRKDLGFEGSWGTNPCARGDMRLLTDKGYVEIEKLSDTTFNIVNKDGAVVETTAWCNGEKDVVSIVFERKDRKPIVMTPDHVWMLNDGSECQTKDLKGRRLKSFHVNNVVNDRESFMAGFILGDGICSDMANDTKKGLSVCFNVDKDVEVFKLFTGRNLQTSEQLYTRENRLVAEKFNIPPEKIGFRGFPETMLNTDSLAGLFSANGCVLKSGKRVALKTIDLEQLHTVKNYLEELSISSYITTNKPKVTKFTNGVYQCKQSYDLNISGWDSLVLFAEKVNFLQLYKRDLLDYIINEKSPSVRAVKPAGKALVYDFTEPETHWGVIEGFVAHNCAEIILRDNGQFCNLSEVVVRPNDTFASLSEKVEIASIIGTAQSTKTNFKYIRQQWADNCNEERLLGVSLSGVCDHGVMQNITYKSLLVRWLKGLKQVAIDANAVHAKKLGISASSAITCVKPSGCRPINSLVTTDNGILTLAEMMPDGDSEWSDISGNSHGGEITKFYRNGDAEVFSINMRFGLTVQSTANHQWMVNGDWKRTDEIVEGDRLEINTGSYTSVVNQHLKKIQQTNNGRQGQITQPEIMYPDISWLFGYLWGDGCLSESKYRIRFTDGSVENLEKANNVLKKYFGISGNIRPASGDKDCSVLEIGCKNLWMWIIENGLFKYKNDQKQLNDIPLIIRKSSQETILAFFSGWFDSDGCFHTPKEQSYSNKCSFTCSQSDFVNHAQHVAWSVGLAIGKSHNTKGENLQKVKSMWIMAMSNGNCTEYAKQVFSKHSLKVTGELNSTRLYETGIVQTIISAGVMPTFDIETEKHWFMAGAVKSHNTVSQLVDAASGVHPRYSEYYIRTVRADTKDPLAHMLMAQGIPNEPCHMNPNDVVIFSFPIHAPTSSVMRNDKTALEQLDMWLVYQRNWCEHKVSITVYVKEHEWIGVMAWVWEYFDEVSGISFLPHSDHSYKQAPYQEIDKETYDKLKEELPVIDWSKLPEFEKYDTTTPQAELACTGGACEIK